MSRRSRIPGRIPYVTVDLWSKGHETDKAAHPRCISTAAFLSGSDRESPMPSTSLVGAFARALAVGAPLLTTGERQTKAPRGIEARGRMQQPWNFGGNTLMRRQLAL